jgi:energy-coupling factor transport system permease protein
MNLFLYRDSKSPIHRLDPRTKLFLLFGIFVLAMLRHDPLYLLSLFSVLLVIASMARCLQNVYMFRTFFILITLITTGLWVIFARGGERAVGLVSIESLRYGLGAALRIDVMILAGLLFLSTTRNEEIVMGFIRLGIPYSFSFAVSTALRLIPTFVGAGSTIKDAQRSRGLDLQGGSLVTRVKNYIPLLVPIFLSTLRNTDGFAMSLESRGFRCGPKRTYYLEIGYRRADWFVLSGFAVILVALLVMFHLQ